MKMFHSITIISLFLSLTIGVSQVSAQEPPPEEPEIPNIPGWVEGTGTYFEITDSEYLNITLDSTETIHLRLESIPQMITMHLESASGVASTVITLCGFPANTTFYQYEDHYHNGGAITTDAGGCYSYAQDISAPHLVFIQPQPGTLHLAPGSGKIPSVGEWDDATRTFTLTMDVSGTIQIGENDLTLDGNGHTATGGGTAYGVYLNARTGVTIQNLTVQGFTYGIYLGNSSGNTLTGNTSSSNHRGIYLYSSSSNDLTDNKANWNNQYGICLNSSINNALTDNTSSNNQYGIRLYSSINNTLTGNTSSSDYLYGISLYDFSNNNTLTNNTVLKSCFGIWLESSSGNTLTGNTSSSNSYYGVWLRSSSGNALTGNTSSSNNQYGIYLYSSSGNTLTGNTSSNSVYAGIGLSGSSSNNTLTNNTSSNNKYGIYLSNSSDNQIYNNNFVNNSSFQAHVYGGSGNIFNQNPPVGGNYWSNWTDPDANFDGFVDSPYVFTGGQDNLPWVLQDGWEICGTPPGPEVVVDPVDPTTGESPVSMTFDQVDTAGTTTLSISQQGQPPPSGLKLGNPPTYYEINTTAVFSGTVTLCFDYSRIQFGNESNLKLMHYENNSWVDCTISRDTGDDIICGQVTSLSSFAIVEPDNTPPVVTVDQPAVTVDEGGDATNTGTISDPDGDTFTLSASVGIVTDNGDGAWSWSFTTSDGPAQSQSITIAADDGKGGTAQESFDLTVSNVAPTITSIVVPLDPVNINDQPVSASATFSDPAGTNDVAYTCTFNYGDATGDQAGSVSDMTCTGPDHTYTMPGVYTISVTVTDKDGGSGSATHAGFVVIYDPEDGFVTGGGWINSPEGAYIADPNLTGKANFGFVSKYKKGADTPTGNTEFNFRMADLNFRSTSYDWLVIAGANAKYKGTGSISNEGEYGFMLTATDGYINGGADKFRIKIWDKATEELIYDNKQGEDDDSYEAQEIDGGSIVIHKDGVASAPAKPKPGEFTLLQNYPNSFNPDTWIPYHLAQDVNVTIRIHSVSGELIKTLDLGHRPAGFYITKDKAAYWDGKNEAGEQVASGIYFYTIQAGEFAATKKMVIAQ